MTVPQIRAIFTALLHCPAASAEQTAEVITQTLQRNEQARIYHWHHATGTFPTRRKKPIRKPTRPKRE